MRKEVEDGAMREFQKGGTDAIIRTVAGGNTDHRTTPTAARDNGGSISQNMDLEMREVEQPIELYEPQSRNKTQAGHKLTVVSDQSGQM